MSSAENNGAPGAASSESGAARGALSRRWLIGILVLAFLFVLMPFLFWRATWFGRPLSDEEITRNLAGREHPRKAQHALSQIADRITSTDPQIHASAQRWYSDVIALARSSHTELRMTSAWVMGQDNTSEAFHQALPRLLADANPMVRRNAALSLVRFGDGQGHDEIRAMLEAYPVKAAVAGALHQRLQPGEAVNPGTLLARIDAAGQTTEVRSEVPGTLGRWLVADRSGVAADSPIATIDPSAEEQWEGLRALYLIGRPEDLSIVESIARGRSETPDYIRKQADLTARAIRQRNAL